MWPTLLLVAVASAASANPVLDGHQTSTPAVDVCTLAPYSAVIPLSSYAPAQSFCTHSYPASQCSSAGETLTSTITTTIQPSVTLGVITTTTATSFKTTTTTVTTSTTLVNTKHVDGDETTTVMITPQPVTTTNVETETATTTQTVSNTPAAVKRDVPSPTDSCSTFGVTMTVYEITIGMDGTSMLPSPTSSPIASGEPAKSSTPASNGGEGSGTTSTDGTHSGGALSTPVSSSPTQGTDIVSSTPGFHNTTTRSTGTTPPPVPTANSTIGHGSSTHAHVTPSAVTSDSSLAPNSTTTDPLGSLFSSVLAQPTSFISTACSCIEAAHRCATGHITATATSTVTGVANALTTVSVAATSTIVATTTATVSAQVTVTVTGTATVTVTKAPATTTVSSTTTTTITTTTTATSTSASTAAATATSTPAASSDCTQDSNICVDNAEYVIRCGKQLQASPGATLLGALQGNSIEYCLNACASQEPCNGISYIPLTPETMEDENCQFFQVSYTSGPVDLANSTMYQSAISFSSC